MQYALSLICFMLILMYLHVLSDAGTRFNVVTHALDEELGRYREREGKSMLCGDESVIYPDTI